jgi:hypothetical protein
MTDKRRDKVEPITRIVQATGLEPEKICEVVYLYLADMHRIMIVDEKGPTAAAMETCFSFGADAAFHLIGLYASNDHYHGRDDDAGVWNEPQWSRCGTCVETCDCRHRPPKWDHSRHLATTPSG